MNNVWTGLQSEIPAPGFQGGPIPGDLYVCTDTKNVYVCIDTGNGTRAFVPATGNVTTGQISMTQLPNPIDVGVF
jgi:hypothetical protein